MLPERQALDSRPQRVLFIITRFLDGGSERRSAAIIEALSALGYSVTLVVGAESRLDRVRELCGAIDVTIEPNLCRSPRPFQDLLALSRLTRLIQRGRYTAVFTCQSKAGVIGRLAARLAGVGLVCHSLSMANFGSGFGWLESHVYSAAERFVGRWTAAYLVTGDDLKQRYLDAGIGAPDRYHVIRSPIDVWSFRRAARTPVAEAKAALGLDTSRPTVAYVGSMEARKGVLELPALQAALRRRLTRPPQLILAGDGELRGDLEQRFQAAGFAGDAVFLGHSQRVPEVMAAADCLVLLSRAEGLPQVLVQAAAAQTPFVSYPVDGAAELVARGAQGVVVPFGDIEAAAAATEAMLSAPRPRAIDLEEWDKAFVSHQLTHLLAELLAAGVEAPSSMSGVTVRRRDVSRTTGDATQREAA